MRGLKLLGQGLGLGLGLVAPFTGAWIETQTLAPGSKKSVVAPFTGAWIETQKPISKGRGLLSRTLHGCVD